MLEISDVQLFKSFKGYFETYLPAVKNKSPNTIETYQYAVNLFNSFIKEKYNKGLTEISADDYTAKNILDFMDWLENDRNNGASTVNLRLFALRSFCKYFMRNDPMRVSELSDIMEISKRTVPDKGDLVYLTNDQIALLFKLPNVSKKNGVRDKFFLELMYDSGCRDQEILSLQFKDFIIDSKKDTVSLQVTGKGSKPRMTPITKKILPSFRKYEAIYHKHSSPTDLMFYTVRNHQKSEMSADNVARFMREYEKIAQETDPTFPHLHPHLLRRSRAMNLYIHGMPLPLISEWLGHTQLETTQIYAQATTEMKRREAEKADAIDASIFEDDIFKYANDEETIKKLYGLS